MDKIKCLLSSGVFFPDIICRKICLKGSGMLQHYIRIRGHRPIFPDGSILGINGDPAFHQNISFCHFTAYGYFRDTTTHDHIRDHPVAFCHQIFSCPCRILHDFWNRHIVFLYFDHQSGPVQTAGGPGNLRKLPSYLFFQLTYIQFTPSHSGVNALLLQEGIEHVIRHLIIASHLNIPHK